MYFGACTKLIKLIRKSVTALLITGLSSAQETPLSEIFFLDLGIVIEPANGSEVFSRVIDKPSKEVSFKIKKAESGSVYLASSEALLSTLERINNRIEKLESSFQADMNILRQENEGLRQTLASLKSAHNSGAPNTIFSSKTKVEDVFPDKPKVKSTPGYKPTKPAPIFDSSIYMSGVFAYQREDYHVAIQKFSMLALEGAPQKTGENIMYWMADSYQQMGDYKNALLLLNQISVSGTMRNDDALVQKGLLHRKMGDESLAQLAFGNVVSQHPESEYFRLAQMELKKSENIK